MVRGSEVAVMTINKFNPGMVLAAVFRAVLLTGILAGPLALLSAPRAGAAIQRLEAAETTKNTGMGFVLLVSLQRRR